MIHAFERSMQSLFSLPIKLIICLMIATLTGCGDATSSRNNNVTDTSDINQTFADSAPALVNSFSIAEMDSMRDNYIDQCSDCHGLTGTGGSSGISLINCPSCSNRTTLINVIEKTMPIADATQCDLNCATSMADYIYSELYLLNSETVSNNNAPSSTNSSFTANETQEAILLAAVGDDNQLLSGKEHYDTQCAGCHGLTGTGGSTGVSLISCPSCNNLDTLVERISTTMPTEGPTLCTGDCATSTAYYITNIFNGSARSNITNIDVTFLSPEKTLAKAASNLAARAPTQREKSYIETYGEAGLQLALEEIVSDEGFCRDRMMEIYNERLRTDANLEEPIYRIYSDTDYPNLLWYKDSGDIEYLAHSRDAVQAAIAREPLNLIAYIACNDRPFTEILTADYTVFNGYGARSLSLGHLEFDDPEDPNELKPTRLSMNGTPISHAGVLSTLSFLKRHQSTDSNLNRGRAYRVYLHFLGTDILSFNGFEAIEDDVAFEHPETQNPNCSVCHQTLDPIASAFFNWDNGDGRGVKLQFDGTQTSPIYEDRPYMWPAGFENEVMPESAKPNALAWIAQRIVEDPRFPRAVVQTMHEGITGQAPLTASEDADTLTTQAFLDQQAFFDDMTTIFVESNYNIKTLTKAMIINSTYFRANRLDDFPINTPHPAVQSIGMSRMLPAEMLNRKLYRFFWFTWMDTSNSFDTRIRTPQLEGDIGKMYGWLDSKTELARITDPNSVIAGIQLQMATEMGLFSALQDFSLPQSERKLLKFVEQSTVPYDNQGNQISANIDAIRSNIEFLHEYLYGDAADGEVEQTLDLFLSIWQQGSASIQNGTNLGLTMIQQNHPLTYNVLEYDRQVRSDDTYVVRAWGATLAYLINDYRFLYE